MRSNQTDMQALQYHRLFKKLDAHEGISGRELVQTAQALCKHDNVAICQAEQTWTSSFNCERLISIGLSKKLENLHAGNG